MSPVLQAVIQGVLGALVILWTLGCLFFIWAGVCNLRPRGYPWLIPLWPLMLLIEWIERRSKEAEP